MKIDIERNVELPVPAAVAWSLLADIEAVASCLPGAKITQRLDETHYAGTVTVKLGPATVAFKGELDLAEFDPATRCLRIVGKGTDTGGASGASMVLVGQVTETGPAACTLSGKSEVTVTGKVAAFGSRLMGTVSDVLLKQFFSNLTAKAEAANVAALSTETSVVAAAVDRSVADQPQAPIEATPVSGPRLDGLALLWEIVKGFFAGLFGRAGATERR